MRKANEELKVIEEKLKKSNEEKKNKMADKDVINEFYVERIGKFEQENIKHKRRPKSFILNLNKSRLS